MPDTMTEPTTDTADPGTAVARYLAVWNERVPEARLQRVTEAFSADAHYVDPLADVQGAEAISAMIGALQDSHPGVEVRLGSPIDAHHDLLRFEWHAVAADGTVGTVGLDIARLADDGRFADVRGFFGSTPQEPAA